MLAFLSFGLEHDVCVITFTCGYGMLAMQLVREGEGQALPW